MEAPQSILFIVVSRIGDTLFATPAIRAVAAAYPEARITVLAHPNRAEVLSHLPFVAEVGTISKSTALWRGWFGRGSYDLAFVYNFDQPLVAYALRVADRVVAFRQADQDLNRRLYCCVEPPAFQSEHAVRQLLRLPAAVGVFPAGYRLAYQCTEIERREAEKRLRNLGADLRPLIGLQVASFPTKSYRDWPVENFSLLCDRITDEWPEAHFLILGGKEEKERTEWLKDRLGPRATHLAGSLTLRQTAAVMGFLDCYVGVDTGPTHLMSAWDIPMVAMYHCLSSSAHTGPLDHPLAYLLDHPATGRGDCGKESSMDEIGVEQVLSQVRRVFAEHPFRPR